MKEGLPLKISKISGTFYARLWQKMKWPGHVSSGSYGVIRGKPPSDFLPKSCFRHLPGCYWLEWRHDAWFRPEDDKIWPLTLHLDLSHFRLAFWQFLEALRSIMFFSHRPAYGVSWTCLVSIRSIDSVCPQAIFLVMVTVFSSRTLSNAIIRSRCRNSTSFCSAAERAGEQACEYFNTPRLKVFEICTYKDGKI